MYLTKSGNLFIGVGVCTSEEGSDSSARAIHEAIVLGFTRNRRAVSAFDQPRAAFISSSQALCCPVVGPAVRGNLHHTGVFGTHFFLEERNLIL
jgi:hypothetical protein